MLPESGPLTDAKRDEVRRALNDYRKRWNLSLKAIALQVPQVSSSTLSQIFQGKYKLGKLDDHLRALNQWMETDARRRAQREDVEYVETKVAKRLIACAERTVSLCAMGLAHGPSGIGKSLVAQIIAEKYHGSIYLFISEGDQSVRRVRNMLGTELHGPGRRGHAPRTYQNDWIFLKLRGSNRLIIVDEAHLLSVKALTFLRHVNERGKVPVLCLATKDLVSRVMADADEDHGQIRSRFAVITELRGVRKKGPGGTWEYDDMFTIDEVRQICQQGKVRLTNDAQAYLFQRGNHLGDGCMRLCRWIVSQAALFERHRQKLKRDDRVTLTAEHLRKTERTFNPDDIVRVDLAEKLEAKTA